MFHLIFAPPAVHSLWYIALSPSIVTKSFAGFAASSRSKSVAVTTVSSFSENLRAVSLMMLKAVGITSFKAFSKISSTSVSNLSIWLKISSRWSIGVSSILLFRRNRLQQHVGIKMFLKKHQKEYKRVHKTNPVIDGSC